MASTNNERKCGRGNSLHLLRSNARDAQPASGSESSFVRHVRHHFPAPPEEVWVCSVCGVTNKCRRAMSQHYRSHQPDGPTGPDTSATNATATSSLAASESQCQYCDTRFSTIHGLRNHEQAKHQPQVSADLAKQQLPATSKNKPPSWSQSEINSFLMAVNRVGLRQNKLIAQIIGTRSISQVQYFKRQYAKAHPIWAIQAAMPRHIQTADCGTQSSPSASPASTSTRSVLSNSPLSQNSELAAASLPLKLTQ